MYSLDRGNENGELENYFKIIEEEAKELRESNPDVGSVSKADFGESSNHYGSRGYGSNRGGSSSNYGSGARNYGSNSNSNYGGGNHYGSSSNNYGSNNNWGANSNNYGGGSGYNNGASSNYGGGSGYNNGANSNYGGGSNYNNGASSNYGNSGNSGQSNHGQGDKTDWGVKTQTNYNPENDPARKVTTIFYSNYSQNSVSQNENVLAHGNGGGDLYQSSGAGDLYQSSNVIEGGDSNEQRIEAKRETVPLEKRQKTLSTETGDSDGNKLTDFDRCLASFSEFTELRYRHLFLTVYQQSDLREYILKILDVIEKGTFMLSIQRDNTLAEAFAHQLCSIGILSIAITNETIDTAKIACKLSDYRCVVTTMDFIRDNRDFFKRPTVLMNFDHILDHVKFLERWLKYCAASSPLLSKDNQTDIYEMCFQNSPASQALKEYIQQQVPRS